MAEDKPSESRKTRKKTRRFWPVLVLIACFFASAAAGALFAAKTIKNLPNADSQIAEIIEPEQLLKVSDKTTVLIMGVDERLDDVGRSDTLIVATIDPLTNQAALLSIPRDTRVKVGYRGFDKINAAYAYGGVRLTENTVENFLGIDIDHYVTVNTHAFVDMVDAIGGVDIDVEKRMYYEDPWDDDGGLIIDLYPGFQHLDGADAVTYVRYRDSEGDIGRVKRQQKFIAAVVDKLTSPEIIPQIPTLIREMIDAVNTDLSMRQILELAGSLNDAYKNGIEMDMVPGHPMYIDDVSYWIPDVEMVRLSVADTLGIEVDPYLRERMKDAASEYNSSIPDRASQAGDNNPVGRPYARERVNDLGRERTDQIERVNDLGRDRIDRIDSIDRIEYNDRTDRTERVDDYDRVERTERVDDYERVEPSPRYDDYERTEHVEQNDRYDYEREDRSERDNYNYSEPTYDDRDYSTNARSYDNQNHERGYEHDFYTESEDIQAPSPNEYRR